MCSRFFLLNAPLCGISNITEYKEYYSLSLGVPVNVNILNILNIRLYSLYDQRPCVKRLRSIMVCAPVSFFLTLHFVEYRI